jgi:hypothetical protein
MPNANHSATAMLLRWFSISKGSLIVVRHHCIGSTHHFFRSITSKTISEGTLIPASGLLVFSRANLHVHHLTNILLNTSRCLGSSAFVTSFLTGSAKEQIHDSLKIHDISTTTVLLCGLYSHHGQQKDNFGLLCSSSRYNTASNLVCSVFIGSIVNYNVV